MRSEDGRAATETPDRKHRLAPAQDHGPPRVLDHRAVSSDPPALRAAGRRWNDFRANGDGDDLVRTYSGLHTNEDAPYFIYLDSLPPSLPTEVG